MHYYGAMMLNDDPLLTQLLQQQATTVLLLDSQFTICYANSSASELFGVSEKRLCGNHLESFFHYHSIDLLRIEQHCFMLGNDCHQHRADVVFNDSRHAKIALNTRKVTLQNHDYVLFECRTLDQELKHDQASHQMHQHIAARTLIRGLAHEIKNPLGGIRGAAQLLQYETEQDERIECANLIIEQADRLTELVDRLLGPNQLPKKELANIHQTLDSVIKLSLLDNQNNITLVKDYDPSIPDILIDNGKIQQVVLNIIKNAQQALLTGGTITLTTRIKHHLRIHNKMMRNALLIKIRDNGPGIDKSLIDTLFFPMVTNKDGGSGLGLAIAQTLIDQHDGYIECDSWPGHTEFSIYLPFKTT